MTFFKGNAQAEKIERKKNTHPVSGVTPNLRHIGLLAKYSERLQSIRGSAEWGVGCC